MKKWEEATLEELDINKTACHGWWWQPWRPYPPCPPKPGDDNNEDVTDFMS